jgi:hypothetical protein
MKGLSFALATLLLLLTLAGVATAATPQDLYNDYAADQVLNGPYTRGELQAYLNDATVHQYGAEAVLGPLDALVTKVLGVWNNDPDLTWAEAVKAATGGSSGGGRGTFPFTGFEVLLASVGGLALIGGGLFMRRATK